MADAWGGAWGRSWGVSWGFRSSTDTHDGHEVKKRVDDEARAKRERAQQLRRQIIDSYGEITGDRVVPDAAQIAREETKIERSYRKPEAKRDALDEMRVSLMEIRRDVAMLRELERAVDSMQQELDDVMFIASFL